MKKSNKIIEAATELLSSFGYYVGNLWHVDDIHFICEQNQYPKLSDIEAKSVFAIANEQFDGEAGLSWPQLEKALLCYYQRESITLLSLPAKSLQPAEE
ncbi:MAG: hypothetical protein EBR02_02585 [Alphaproteobacteria bacterium]|nr:hypothetical protein [Alphaproteobacteria bacterium]